jgi:pSer/pThr/pTyr-binding forkhead associated (FHA) protein
VGLVTRTFVPQLFLRSDSPYAQQGVIDGGFWSPLAWMTRSPTALPAGYYYALMGKKFWTIGSGSDCTILFRDDLISSQHALLIATAEREVYFCDLQSVNGSFVNDEPVTQPVRLQHGDLLRIGLIEIEFQHSGKESDRQPLADQRLVLLVQDDELQAKIWHRILKACGIPAICEHFVDQSLKEKLDTLITPLEKFPDLLLVDMETLKPNPYEFCRWCREHYPSLKIILTCRSRTEISLSEKRWVAQQGAVDLLPGFSQESFFSLHLTDVIDRIECVLEALELPMAQLSSLEPMLRSLMQNLNKKPDAPQAESSSN